MDSDEDDEEPKNEPGTSSRLSALWYQCYLYIKDQQPVCKEQLPVQTLGMKAVSMATSVVHDVRSLEAQCPTQIFMS